MSDYELDNIIIKLCALRRYDDVAHVSLSDTDIENIAKSIIGNGVPAWIISTIDKFYSENQSLFILKEKLKPSLFSVMADCQRKLTTFFEISSLLSEEGVNIVAMKGVAMMSAFYPEITQRPTGDIDIWINHNDIYRAHQILINKFPNSYLGKKTRTTLIPETIATHLPVLIVNGIIIELHFNLYSADSNVRPNVNFEEHIVNFDVANRKVATFDIALMLYHLSTHLLKSRRTKGIRLSWVIDIMLLLNAIADNPQVLLDVLSMNLKQQEAIKNLWVTTISMLPQDQSNKIADFLHIAENQLSPNFLKCTDEGLKPGLAWRIKTIRVLLCEMLRQVSRQKGFSAKWKHLKDMIFDLKNKNKK